MLIKRRSKFTGSLNEMDLPISESEFIKCFEAWNDGKSIQDAFPSFNADQREFIMTGCTPSEWKHMFGNDGD